MNKPKMVVFCGSSRFVDIMAVAAWLVEREENAIAMGLHLLPCWYRSQSGDLPEHHLAEHEGVADKMDALHRRKIDLADEIFVINFRDYIGSSTCNEIEYAKKQGKPIRWYNNDYIGRKVDAIIQAVAP
jgi:nucleoside 2-deoxyribosyltransferase